VRRNAAKGRKKFLTCLRYMREPKSFRYFTRVSKVVKQTPPPTLSLSLSLSLTQFSLFRPLVQPPILLSSAVASPLSTTSTLLLLLLLLLLGCCTLFTPFAGARALLSFDGESERSRVPWRAAASFNWDTEPQLQCVCVRVYSLVYARAKIAA